MTLDGFIAGPNGEYDWIVADPAIDFAELYRGFDVFVMGRKTFEVAVSQVGSGEMPGMKGKQVFVFSRTLRPADYPNVEVTSEDPAAVVRRLKSEKGKDIWLFGGGELFRTLADAGLVDLVELAVMPVLLGEGIPLVPRGRVIKDLRLIESKALPSGIIRLKYATAGRS